MSIEALAFFTGLFGSLHCVAMCGPLVLALPFPGQSLWAVILQKLLYQAGRILMYGVLGIAIGSLGSGFSFLGLQQTLSLVTGFLLLLAGVNYFIKGRTAEQNPLVAKVLHKLTALLSRYLSKPYGGFVAGGLNGLLPCGVTYIALAQAINLNTPLESGRFMLFFGMGTVPLLFITAISPLFFKKFKAPRLLIPTLFIIAGSFLMLRGLNLHVPYISHLIDHEATAECD